RYPAASLPEPGVADPVRAAIPARSDNLRIGMPLGAMVQELIESQRIALHLAVDHGHPGASPGSGGATMPTFQCHGRPPWARRRHTTVSTSSYIPGIRRSPGAGVPSKAM